MTGARVAVIGGGIFGVTAAINLARAGHRAVLWERTSDLLMGASRTNQRRLHRGYHYPRSPATAAAARDGARSFMDEYPTAVVTGQRHYVAISNNGSLTTADQYLNFCDRMNLEYVEEFPAVLRRDTVDLCLRVREWAIDLDTLRKVCWSKLRGSGVEVRLSAKADPENTADFDNVVVATYSALNEFQCKVRGQSQILQFEVCEKPLVRLPRPYAGTSMVVLDGPFMSFDPVMTTGDFLVGNVAHAIHSTTFGLFPVVPAQLWGDLDAGVRPRPANSRFAAFVTDASRYFIDFESAEYLGSLYTVRTVLPGLDATDARPTVVRRVDDRTISVFSGKIATCVQAAREIVQFLEESHASKIPDAVRIPR